MRIKACCAKATCTKFRFYTPKQPVDERRRQQSSFSNSTLHCFGAEMCWRVTDYSLHWITHSDPEFREHAKRRPSRSATAPGNDQEQTHQSFPALLLSNLRQAEGVRLAASTRRAMAMPAERIDASDFEVNGRLSDARRAKLMDLKKREDLKDQLTEKFKSRFGHGACKEADEVSVNSAMIRKEVENFARKAPVTNSNLDRLERRIQSRAQGRALDDASTVSKAISGVSQYTGLSQRSRSATSLVGQHLVAPKRKHDWSKLDDYASYLHEQDALRQKLGVQALQRKMKLDLDAQVQDKLKRRDEALEEEKKHHENTLLELERWKQQEKEREEERHQRIQKEKEDRDEQLRYERLLKDQEEQRKKDEEAQLVEKIVNEMEADQKRFEKKKEQTKRAMRKVFEQNKQDQLKRDEAAREAKEKEAATIKEFNRLVDEQEEAKAKELHDRMARQAELMKKLQDNVNTMKQESGDTDEARARAQQDEADRHYFEAESIKQQRLKQMKLENQAYLLKQMHEKDGRKDDDKYLTAIQAQIMDRDTQEFNAVEKKKIIDRKERSLANQREIIKQMEWKAAQREIEMSDTEVALNKPLLELVDRTLDQRDENMELVAQIDG